MISIAGMFNQISAFLMILSYTLNEFSKIFQILLDFIKNAPDDFFESPKSKKAYEDEIPLFLSEKGVAALKEKLSEFPRVFGTGGLQLNWRKPKDDPGKQEAHPNFLYLMGQELSALAMRLDFLDEEKNENYEKHKPEIKALFKIWGSREHMNALSLFSAFKSNNNETARKKLEKKISDTVIILKKFTDG
jgi:hypothetical protein